MVSNELLICHGVTKIMTRCKNIGIYADNNHMYCYWHVPRLNETCVICLSDLYDIVVLLCGHTFHKKCIKKWLCRTNQCPICRVFIDQ